MQSTNLNQIQKAIWDQAFIGTSPFRVSSGESSPLEEERASSWRSYAAGEDGIRWTRSELKGRVADSFRNIRETGQ